MTAMLATECCRARRLKRNHHSVQALRAARRFTYASAVLQLLFQVIEVGALHLAGQTQFPARMAEAEERLPRIKSIALLLAVTTSTA